MITLYQFPISHYCEKIRWALDFKRLDYKKKNLLPGPHLLTTRKLANRTSMPILTDGTVVVQGSRQIIDHLDSAYPERPLTPQDSLLAEQAREWEQYADEEIGVHCRRAAYHVLLEHPAVVIPFFAHEGPWYAKPLLKVIFPKLRQIMRKGMNIDATTSQFSRERLAVALQRIDAHLSSREFMVGDSLSRADIAVAALAAPMCRPNGYGLDWPERFPAELETWIEANSAQLSWVDRLYDGHRAG